MENRPPKAAHPRVFPLRSLPRAPNRTQAIPQITLETVYPSQSIRLRLRLAVLRRSPIAGLPVEYRQEKAIVCGRDQDVTYPAPRRRDPSTSLPNFVAMKPLLRMAATLGHYYPDGIRHVERSLRT